MDRLIYGIVFGCVLFRNKQLVLVVMFGYTFVCMVMIVRETENFTVSTEPVAFCGIFLWRQRVFASVFWFV
jgi:hypothetical protein